MEVLAHLQRMRKMVFVSVLAGADSAHPHRPLFVPRLSVHVFPVHFRPLKMLDFDVPWQILELKRPIIEKMSPTVVGDIAVAVHHPINWNK
jgi:hypothetical protein